MESIYVPKGLNLYVDIDKSEVLNAIIVEGSLIFAPETDASHERFFDARYIFLRNGSMEVGTEEFPYTSKITITMHGGIYDPYLPVFGNKVIGCSFCTLDMHGPKRQPVWTVMEETANIGDASIKLSEAVDWKVGEVIAIAATGFDPHATDKRMIKSIDNTIPDKPVITLDKPLTHKHFAAIESYGS